MIVEDKMDVDFKQIGRNMKKYRYKKGMTQDDVCGVLNMSSYKNSERGSEAVCLWRLIQCCELYEVTPNDLLRECTPALSDAWKSELPDDEHSRTLEALRCECQGLTTAQRN